MRAVLRRSWLRKATVKRTGSDLRGRQRERRASPVAGTKPGRPEALEPSGPLTLTLLVLVVVYYAALFEPGFNALFRFSKEANDIKLEQSEPSLTV